MRMHRRVLTCLLSVFLLLMQQEGLRHAIDHVGSALRNLEHSALELPAGDHCTECDLLAGAAGTASPAPLVLSLPAPSWLNIAAPSTTVAVVTPSYYQSRAPPAALRYA